MDTNSVNGVLKPIVALDIEEQYLGHYLKISYIQKIARQAVFSADRADVDPQGKFRFFIPKQNLLENDQLTVEVYAPDGLLLHTKVYSYGSLYSSNIPPGASDETSDFVINVNPQIIDFKNKHPDDISVRKISGKVIDLSGKKNPAGLNILIMASNEQNADFNSESFRPVFTSITGHQGYFYGQLDITDYQQAYGLIAGAEDNPIVIHLENNTLPSHIILAIDLSDLADSLFSHDNLSKRPDANDLVNSDAFSQDLGGHCVDFTIPNRTLEEYSFYHTVRTTEPEIKGFVITPKETREFKQEFISTGEKFIEIAGLLNGSFSTLSVMQYEVEEQNTVQTETLVDVKKSSENKAGINTSIEASRVASAVYIAPVYQLKLASGNQKLALTSRDLLASSRALQFADILKFLADQKAIKRKLERLHLRLAQAYCGKDGAQEALTYCESLKQNDLLARSTLASLIGHIDEYLDSFDEDKHIQEPMMSFIGDINDLLDTDIIEANEINRIKDKATDLIHEVDKNSKETQDQEELLGYLRRIVKVLAKSTNVRFSNFEPCPDKPENNTMGILCLIQEFQDIRERIRNNATFTLSEILLIRNSYDQFIKSINAFMSLLNEFYSFHTSSSRLATNLEDSYFADNYSSIKSTLSRLRVLIYAAIHRIERIQQAYITNHPGRQNLAVENSIDWDESPTIYENTTIAHGHILHFKQQWKADGYSLGDLLYSLPLAPCQEKQIAIIDWDRQESAARQESQDVVESLSAEVSRDRDISEIMNSSFAENINASSSNTTRSTSAGIGGGIGGFIGKAVFGIAGGVSHSGATSTSTANQNSSRNLSGNSLNRLQDTVSQSASSLRSQRSTVIQLVGQNEQVSVQTEVIKNNNHCHAMTVEYFEVLKHYAIEQSLVDVQECLFVPLPMSHFDHDKILRWSNSLRRTIYGRKLSRGFDAIERIESDYVNSDFPVGSYAEQSIEAFDGYITLSFELTRPFNKTIDETTKTEEYDLSIPFPWFFGRKMVFHLEREVPLTEAEKDAMFEREFAPDIARMFIDELDIHGISDNGDEVRLDLDFSLLSNYKKGRALRINIASKSRQNINRNQIKHLRFRANTNVKPSSRIFLVSAYLHYRTDYSNDYIIRNGRINNDIINSVEVEVNLSQPPYVTVEQKTDAALLYTPPNSRETRNPRKEDSEAAAALKAFLNEHLEMAHKVIWSSMDSSRLFGLLDGYLAPNSGNRSVASLVENKISGIVGNNLVLKVVPGVRLDPVFKPIVDLIAYYQPATPVDPFRISVPTRGVYAESVMGKCNSCEEIDETRHWRFEDVPCGTKPADINPVSSDSRRTDPGNLQVKDLPGSIINMQSAPAAPDPTSLAAAYALLGKGDSFADLTGLKGTQANALGALQTTSKSVTDLASVSKDFANMAVLAGSKKDGSKQIEQIKKLNKDGILDDEETKEEIKKVLDSYTNAAKSVNRPTKPEEKTITDKIAEKTMENAASKPNQTIEYTKVSSDGESESIKVGSSSEDSGTTPPTIVFSGATSAAELRAFKPATDDRTLVIEVSGSAHNAAEGSRVKWSPGDASALKVDTVDSNTTRVRGIKPGKQDLGLLYIDAGGNTITRKTLKLSVPQCVVVKENEAEFDAALSALKVESFKTDIIAEMQRVVERLLVKANVRVFWQLGADMEKTPDHVPADSIVVATIRNKDPNLKGRLGVTFGQAAGDSFNETIEIYPGMYTEEDDIDVDTETRAIVIQLEEDLPGDGNLLPTAASIFGRLFGETLSHEIGHALLWDDIPDNRHNEPPIPNDLMNQGFTRFFRQRTGYENTALQSPVEPWNFTDHGIDSIGGFQAHNQQLIDNQWPVPPAHS